METKNNSNKKPIVVEGNYYWVKSFKKDDIIEMTNEVFDKRCGIAYFPLDKDWEVIEYKVVKE